MYRLTELNTGAPYGSLEMNRRSRNPIAYKIITKTLVILSYSTHELRSEGENNSHVMEVLTKTLAFAEKRVAC